MILGWIVLCGLLALLITGANILIIVVFSRRTLRKRSNILLVGLAVVDLMVGSLAVPLLIASYFSSSGVLRIASYHVGIITAVTSVFTLAIMSLERMYAVCWPFRHRTLSRRTYIFAACLPWIQAGVGTLMGLLANDRDINLVLVSSILALIVICTAYYVIWKKQRQSSLYHQSAALNDVKERKLAKTILIVVGAFVVTWVPFAAINIYMHVTCMDWTTSCEILRQPGIIFLYVTVFLRLSSSFVNCLVYSLRMPEFRENLPKLFLQCKKRTRRQEAARVAEVRKTAVQYNVKQ